MKKRALILVGLLCLIGIVCAQVSPNYDLSWYVIGGGGGPMSSTSYRMGSTVGQIIGLSESNSYKLGAGYWYGAVTPAAPYPRWDINEDGSVNYLDLGMLAAHWGESY